MNPWQLLCLIAICFLLMKSMSGGEPPASPPRDGRDE